MEVCEAGLDWFWTAIVSLKTSPSASRLVLSMMSLATTRGQTLPQEKHATCNASPWTSFFPRGCPMGGSRTNRFSPRLRL